ncbi:MAG: proteasome assembly chaperone family protein [Candidatus Bathyarchaeia archaeon]
MKETIIKELTKVELKSPVMIEGLPGLGLVGKIAVRYLIRQLGAQKFAYMISPHFPYFVIVNKKGGVRLLRGVFYFWRNETGENDLILFTGDSQAQTIEGQYEISNKILDFAEQYNVKLVITLGGYRVETKEKPKVIASATSQMILERALKADAIISPIGSPIVGTAGLILGLAPLRDIDALCLLGETRGYLPDPKAAKSVLEVLLKFLNINIDLSGMDEEITKAESMVARLQKVEEKRILQEELMRRSEDKKITYIS